MARPHPGSPPGLIDRAVAVLRRVRRRLRERRCRRTARPEALDADRTLVTVLERWPLVVDARDRGLSASLAAQGYWEMWLTEAIGAALRPGMTAIDVGANVGYFALLMADRVGPAGRVHAFEPNAAMAARLSESASRNGCADRVIVHGTPLWDEDGLSATLLVPEGEPKNAHVEVAADAEGALLTRRLDAFGALLDADLVKIDAEGAEERIWRGMAGLLARGRALTVFLEYTPVRYADPRGFLDRIVADGFALAELSVSHGIRAITADAILAGDPEEDRMLALVRPAQRIAA